MSVPGRSVVEMALDSPSKDPRAVDAWLESYELGEYAAGIKDAGYSSVRFLVAANGADLEEVMAEVGMKRAHAKVFTAAWAELVASGGGSNMSSRHSSTASSPAPSLTSDRGLSAGDAAVDDGDAERVRLLIPPPQSTMELPAQVKLEADGGHDDAVALLAGLALPGLRAPTAGTGAAVGGAAAAAPAGLALPDSRCRDSEVLRRSGDSAPTNRRRHLQRRMLMMG